MKLFAIIFVAAISISSALPTFVLPSEDAKLFRCPDGYQKQGLNCRRVIERLRCPAGAGIKKGDRCVIESKYCPLGYKLQDNNQMCEMVNSSGTCQCEKGYIFNKETGECEKILKRKPLRKFCGEYLVAIGNKCVALPRPAQRVCPDMSDENKGCRPVRFEKRNPFHCASDGAIADPTDPNYCVYEKPGSVWCPPEFYTLNEKTNMCESNTVHAVVGLCQNADHRYENGVLKCFIFDKKKAECSCSPSTGGLKRLEKPILTCFEGTIDGGGVCAITKTVAPVLECPLGFSADRAKTFCVSDHTSAAL